MKTKAIALTKTLLFARRNNDLKAEQKAHQKLLAFCDKNNLNFENVLAGATKHIISTVSGGMNSL